MENNLTHPGAGSQSGYNQSGFDWKQYGVRVPAVIVSPLVAAQVDSTVYDHTSVLATLNNLFGTGSLTQRDAQANSLLHLIWDPQKSASPPVTVNQSPPPLSVKSIVAPAVKVSLSPDRRAQIAKQPLPDKGNICGMLGVAMKAEYELSNGTSAEQQAILAKSQTITTKGEAQAYMESVKARVRARKQKLNQK